MPVYTPFANESDYAAQAEHAHDAYMTGATGLPVQDDVDARVTEANATHDSVANSALGTDLNVTVTQHPWGPVTTYSGANIVAYADETTITSMENLVRTRLASDDLHNTGFGVDSPVIDGAPTEFVDPLVLIEAAKLTGEKPY